MKKGRSADTRPTKVICEPRAATGQVGKRDHPDLLSGDSRRLFDLFGGRPRRGPCRRYVLERIDGELVFRQLEIDALVEAAIAELAHPGRAANVRRVIKLPKP